MKPLIKELCRENIANLCLLTNVDLLEVIFIVVEVLFMKLNKKTKSAAAAYILGLSPQAKVKGTKSEIHAFTEVLKSSKVLYNTLNDKTASGKTISEALAMKTTSAKQFADVFGHSWPF